MSIGISHPAIDTTKLDICERFEFSKQAEFRKAFTGEPARNNFVLDFSKTAHIDSSALGIPWW